MVMLPWHLMICNLKCTGDPLNSFVVCSRLEVLLYISKIASSNWATYKGSGTHVQFYQKQFHSCRKWMEGRRSFRHIRECTCANSIENTHLYLFNKWMCAFLTVYDWTVAEINSMGTLFATFLLYGLYMRIWAFAYRTYFNCGAIFNRLKFTYKTYHGVVY